MTDTAGLLDSFTIKCNRYIHRAATCMHGGVVVADARRVMPFQTYSALRMPCRTHLCDRCAKARRAEIAKRIRYFVVANPNVHLLTLTLRAGTHKVGQIATYWKRLRARLWKIGIRFKFFMVREFTKKGTEHLHILVGRKFSRGFISKLWKEITGDSYIVDVRRADEGAVSYLSKYLSKAQKQWQLIVIHRLRLFSHSKGLLLGQYSKLKKGSLIRVFDSYIDAQRHADDLNRESLCQFFTKPPPPASLSTQPPF